MESIDSIDYLESIDSIWIGVSMDQLVQGVTGSRDQWINGSNDRRII
jgi:hypothetical protein